MTGLNMFWSGLDISRVFPKLSNVYIYFVFVKNPVLLTRKRWKNMQMVEVALFFMKNI